MMRLGSHLSRTKATEHSSDGHIPHDNDNHDFLGLLLCHRNGGGGRLHDQTKEEKSTFGFSVVIFYI